MTNWKKIEMAPLSSSINAIYCISFSSDDSKNNSSVPFTVKAGEITTLIAVSTSLGHVIVYCRILHMIDAEIIMTDKPTLYIIDECKTPLSQTP